MPWPSSAQAATRGSLITMASIHSGEMFRPEEVTSRLSFRPVTERKPSWSTLPRSPVRHGASARGAVQIAVHDGRSAHDDLAVLDAYIEAGQRLAHGSRLAPPWPVHGHDRAAFGEAIAFMHGDAELPGARGQSLRDAARRRPRRSASFPARALVARLELRNQPESNCGTSTAVVGRTASNAAEQVGWPAGADIFGHARKRNASARRPAPARRWR